MTTALTTGYAIPIPPLATGGVTDGYATLMQEADDHIKGDVNTLSGYVTTMSGVLTTLSGNVTTLSGNVTTLSASVSTLSSYITPAWTDYSATSTIVGWSSFTVKVIKYKKIGTTVFVSFFITGTSDNTLTSFTVPFNSTGVNETSAALGRLSDNNTYQTSPGLINLSSGSNVVSLYKTSSPLGDAWTAANTKQVAGQFCYEAAI